MFPAKPRRRCMWRSSWGFLDQPISFKDHNVTSGRKSKQNINGIGWFYGISCDLHWMILWDASWIDGLMDFSWLLHWISSGHPPRNGRFEHGVVASALGLTTPHLGGFVWRQDRNVSWRECTNNETNHGVSFSNIIIFTRNHLIASEDT